MNYTVRIIKQSIQSFKSIASKSNVNYYTSTRSKSIIVGKLYKGLYTHRVAITHFNKYKLSSSPNPTDIQKIVFLDEMHRLFNQYEMEGKIQISGNAMSECEKCKFVIEKFLEPYTQTLLPNHVNIKCCIPILEEEGLLSSISNLTGVSTINLREYFKKLGESKIDEKDTRNDDNSFQYNGIVHYCRVSAIAKDICQWIGPCSNDLNHFNDIQQSYTEHGSYVRL